jgi:hypothetical protein
MAMFDAPPSWKSWIRNSDRDEAARAISALSVLWPVRRELRAPLDLNQIVASLQRIRASAHHHGRLPSFLMRSVYWIREFPAAVISPALLAEAWGAAFGDVRPGLIVDPDEHDSPAGRSRRFAERVDVTENARRLIWDGRSCEEVVFPILAEGERRRWDWPLRVGAAGPRALERLLRDYGLDRLYPLVEPAHPGGGRSVDVLLLDIESLQEPRGDGRGPRPLATVIFLPNGENAAAIAARFPDLDERLWLGAIVALVQPEELPEWHLAPLPFAWLDAFVRSVTGDRPLISAVFEASRQSRAFPTVLADEDAIAEDRLSQVIRRKLFEAAPREDVWLDLSPGLAHELHTSEGPKPFAFVRERLMDALGYEGYLESYPPATAVRLFELIQRQGFLQREQLVEDRWLQAQVLDADPSWRLATAIERDRSYRIRVWVGPETPGALRTDQRFPGERIEWASEWEELTVVFTEPAFAREPQVQTIDLPFNGQSTYCVFTLETRRAEASAGSAPPEGIEARIVVLHKYRVIQTALLTGRFEDPDREIRFRVEATPRPGLRDLAERRAFDAAIVVNRTAQDEPTVLLIGQKPGEEPREFRRAETSAVLKTLQPLLDSIDDIAARLSRMAEQEWHGDLGETQALELLRFLAQHGRNLYDTLIADTALEGRFADAGRIQVVSAHLQAFLPVELFYDRVEPLSTAALCPAAAEALRAGACGAECAARKENREFLCPLGFWGLSRVIERHVHDPALAEELGPGDFRLQIEPAPRAGTLPIFKRSLCAASQRVWQYDPTLVPSLNAALERVTRTRAGLASNWAHWRELAAAGPSLLVLVPHTESHPVQKFPTMEIGDAAAADVVLLSDVDERYLGTKPPVAVFLLGCETGNPDAAFRGFIARFRRLKAALVVTVLSKVLGRHAVPVAVHLIEAIERELDAGTTAHLGALLTAVRRALLADGYVMALGLTAYGDADWTVVPAAVPEPATAT